MSIEPLSKTVAADMLRTLRSKRPLVHCLTNEVVQEITANVLLAAGASPAMVVAEEEAATFAAVADALLVNVGTPYPARLRAMHASAQSAAQHAHPWVLDPVAAGGIPWRDGEIRKLLLKKPDVVRGNASEIMALAGAGSGGKGVDSTNASDEALASAQRLAADSGAIVCVTGETDYITNGTRTLAVTGGHVMTTLVVGTGCSLSALVAAFCGAVEHSEERLEATAAACLLAKRASERAYAVAPAPGSFHAAYLDALYQLTPEAFLS